MAKKSKTLKQKIASDKRLINLETEPTQMPFQYAYTERTSARPAKAHHTTTTNIYTHITHDLRKTISVTTFIVFIQLLIYYFMYFS